MKLRFKSSSKCWFRTWEVAVITGIGCSDVYQAISMHTVYGKPPLPAQGVKWQIRFTVIASGGDGDGYAIGMGHTTLHYVEI